jgi:colanic acid/amylovoran biosynthesis glycosyltransferase
MRVLAYTENYAHKTVTFITNELKYLDEHHELHLAYSARINPELYNLKHMHHVPFQFNPISNKLRWWLEQFEILYWCHNFKFKKQLNSLIKKINPQIIHCHFGTDFLKLAENISSEFKQIPIVISFYGFDITEKSSNAAYLKLYKKHLSLPNVYSYAVSSSLVELINKKIKPRNKAQLLHSGINVDYFKRIPYTKEKGTFTFLQVSSYLEKKGHHLMLLAFKKFIESDKRFAYKLILVGFGPLEDQVRERVKELNLEQWVEMREPINQQGIIELCSHADCFLQFSIKATNGDCEGLPNAILEAMALEMPILSTRHAGIPEIVEHGVNGILCEEKNIEQYIDGFKQIVNWPLCPQNREKVVKQFSFNSHCHQLETIYRHLTETNSETAL